MDSEFTKDELETICRDLLQMQPITRDYLMICGCCGAIKNPHFRVKNAATADKRIYFNQVEQTEPIPQPNEGFDGFLLPDMELNLLIEWHTQYDKEGILLP